MTNYLDFALILEPSWGAVENEDFLGNVQKTHSFSAKNASLFNLLKCVFAVFHTRLLWFRAKSAFWIFGEIIAFFADFTFVFAKCSLGPHQAYDGSSMTV